MKLIVEIEMNNAAFEFPNYEAGRLLSKVSREVTTTVGLRTPREPNRIADINGNTVGSWRVVHDDSMVVDTYMLSRGELEKIRATIAQIQGNRP